MTSRGLRLATGVEVGMIHLHIDSN
jgi:hypothetical protein